MECRQLAPSQDALEHDLIQPAVSTVMTCSRSDARCSIVAGAPDRFSLQHEDPKAADGTPEEAQCYDEPCRQIAADRMYVMPQAGR